MKEIHCRDAGFDCDGIVHGETEEDVVNQAVRHAKDAHDADLNPMRDQLVGAVRSN